MCGGLSHTPYWGPGCNPGTCPDWESNQQFFDWQAGTQSNEWNKKLSEGLSSKLETEG